MRKIVYFYYLKNVLRNNNYCVTLKVNIVFHVVYYRQTLDDFDVRR